jgi:RsmE family RNA methyltransferase
MNVLLMFEEDLLVGQSLACIRGSRYQHMLRVQGFKQGDRLRVGLLNGQLGTGEITYIANDHLQLIYTLEQDPPAPLPVILILALPRPKMLKRVLASATAMGVKEFFLVNTYRVQKSFWQSPWLRPDKLQQQLIEGLQQAGDTIMPKVKLQPRFKPFVEDQLPTLMTGRYGLVADPQADQPCPCQRVQNTLLVVGPEGGLLDYEINKLYGLGFQGVHLGARILRVETVVPALLARLF